MDELHSLLKRQLKRITGEAKPFIEAQVDFIRAINNAYEQFDADRRMLEHSLELTSQELLERNAELSRSNAELELRVAARTAELSGSEARFRGLFEHAPVSIWEEDFSAVRQYIDELRGAGVVDFSAYLDAHPEVVVESAARVTIVDVNHTTLEMYQAESKEQLLADLTKILGAESLIPFKEELLALIRGDRIFETELVNYTLRGERRVVFLRLTVAPGYTETWSKVFVGISDITRRREAEAALAAERDLLQALMDNIPDLIYFKDTSSRFTRINRAEARLLGVATPEDAIGKTDLDFQSPDLAQSFYEEEQHLVQTGKSVINRIEFNPTPNGQPRWFSTTKVPIKDEAGQVTSIVGVSHDITKLRQAEVALRESEQRYRTLFESSQRQAQELALLDRVRQALAREVELPLIFRTVVEGIAQTFGYTLVSLYLVDGDVLVLQHQVGYDHVIERIPITQGITGRVVRSQQPMLVEDVRNDPMFLEAIEGVTSEVCVPLFNQDQVAGALNVESIHGVRFSEADLRLMIALGDQIGIALGRARLYSDVRNSEQRFRQLAEHIQQVFWLEDSDLSHMFYISPAYETIWGRTPQSLYEHPQSWFDSIHPDERERVRAAQVQKVRGEYNLEYRVNRPDGTVRWIWSRAFPIQDEHGHIYRIAGIAEDITERKQVEAALAAERDLLQALMDNIPDTIYFKDTKSRFTRINRAQANVLGVASPEDAIGKTDLDFQASELAQSFYEEEQRIVKSGEPLMNRVEFNPTADGKPRWFSATKMPIKDADGKVIGMVGISRDITERKQIEEALREAENKYRALVEQLPAIVYLDQYDPTLSAGYRPVYMSPQVEIILGYHPEEFIENPDLWPSLLHPDDRQQTLDAEGWHYKAGEPLHQEYRVIARDGRVVWLRDEGVMIKDEVNGKAFSQGVLLDITARKQAEEALRKSEERFRLISWATKDASWDWDLKTDQIFWGTSLQKVFHYSAELTHTESEWRHAHIHPQDQDKVNHSIRQALEGGMEFWSKEYRFQRFDGSYADIMDRGYILRNGNNEPYRMIGAMMDITERRQAEATILHHNEMLSSLHQITLDLLRHREINPLLNALVELASKFMDAPHVEIMLVEDETLVVRAVTQTQPHLIGERVGRGQAMLSWQAVDTREPAVLRDYQTWPYRRAIYDKFPLHAVADFPILNDDQCLGVLALGRDKPGYEFTFDQIQYGRLFANLTALVLNNAQLREALREQSIRDSLTGLYNRRYMEETLKRELSRVTRQLHPLGIIMLDIDHFKRINDTYGHAMGDALLRELGQLLKRHIRREDIACRYGGEEFVLIMPDASLEVAQQRAELLREDARKLGVQDESQSLEGVTLSLGIAIYPQHGRNMETVLRAADAALYRAKQEGRDRVVMAVG